MKNGHKIKCCICGKIMKGYSNNAEPVVHNGLCCDKCNETIVIPVRFKELLDITSEAYRDIQ